MQVYKLPSDRLYATYFGGDEKQVGGWASWVEGCLKSTGGWVAGRRRLPVVW